MDKTENKKETKQPIKTTKKFWGPVPSILLTAYAYVASLALGTILVSVYPRLQGWNQQQTNAWLDSTNAQFWLILFVDGVVLLIVWWLLHLRRKTFKNLGLTKPRWKDLLYALGGFIVYFLLYVVVATIVKLLVPNLDLEQTQQVGFETARQTSQLIIVFISLVLIPPFVEEILFRGFLYTGLKTKWPKWLAAVVTSFIFAAAHLQFGSGAPLLWVAAIDTFVLSLVLVYLREKTGGLGAPMVLHAMKNCIAFTLLFIVGVV